MKKRIISVILCVTLAIGAVGMIGCGDDPAPVSEEVTPTPTPTKAPTATPAPTKEATPTPTPTKAAPVESVTIKGEGIGDYEVTKDLIKVGYRAISEDEKREMVFSVFDGPEKHRYALVFLYENASHTAKFFVGDCEKGSGSQTDENGNTWNYITFKDIYSNRVVELGVVTQKTGETIITVPDGTVYYCAPLSPEGTVEYLASVINAVDEAKAKAPQKEKEADKKDKDNGKDTTSSSSSSSSAK